MARFLVLYRSSLSAREQIASTTPGQRQAGMALWSQWAERAGHAIVDLGSPLGGVATVTAAGRGPAGGEISGFSVFEARSTDEVVALLEGHPHFHSPGDPSIEVLEYLPMPGN